MRELTRRDDATSSRDSFRVGGGIREKRERERERHPYESPYGATVTSRDDKIIREDYFLLLNNPAIAVDY